MVVEVTLQAAPAAASAGSAYARAPAEAVLEANGGRAFVYRLSPDGKRAVRTPVTFGGFDGDDALSAACRRGSGGDGGGRVHPRPADGAGGRSQAAGRRRRRRRRPDVGALTRFAVERWQFTLVAFALLAALGISSLMSIARAEDPNFPVPFMFVRVVLPGRSRRTWSSWSPSRSKRR
jgi:hypothetical protein